jgi:P27 family predicted phage terminase small subunit
MERYKNYGDTVAEYMKAAIDDIKSRGLLQSIDWVQLDILAWNYYLWQTAQADVLADGLFTTSANGGPMKSPAIDVANAAIRQATAIAEAYGLTPMSRKKLTRGEDKTTSEVDPLAEFFKDEG